MPDQGRGRDAEAAAGLLRFLRDLAAARRAPVRDVGAYPQVHWLAGLPGDVYVEADAGPGDVLFSVPVIPLTPPAVLAEFDGWLALRHWYRILRDLAAVRGQETVLATGLLTRRPVRDHLLHTPVRIAVDERSGRIDVVLTGPAALRDRELLPGLRPERTDWLRESVQAGQGLGLNASVADVLRKWAAAAGEDMAFREDWAPDDAPGGPARIRLAPALVVRPPGRAPVADLYQELLGRSRIPEGFARLLGPAGRSPIMHVPGGAAALVADLLGRGVRVLVATADATAAADLHAALPPGIGTLCALPATAARVAERLRTTTIGPATLGELADREAQAAWRVAELRERAPAERPVPLEHAWIPARPGLPADPPITAPEAAELIGLPAGTGPDRTVHRDVDPAALPSAPYVRTLVETEHRAAERARRADTEPARRLRRCDVTVLARLDGNAATINAALRDLGLTGHPGGWDLTDHAVRAFTDALARRRPAVWARVAELSPQVDWAVEALERIAGHEVVLPPDSDPHRLAPAAEDLWQYLAEGTGPKRGPLRSGAQRQAERLLQGAEVDGEPPATPDSLEVLHAYLNVLLVCQDLQYVWEEADVSFPADVPVEDRIARFRRAHDRLGRVRALLPVIEDTGHLLTGSGIPITHPLQWYGFSAALESALLVQDAARATTDLNALRDSIPAMPHDPPELHAARTAIDARDPDAYARALEELAKAQRQRAAQIRRAELLERVRAVHPGLADLLSGPDEEWPDRIAHWDAAWAVAAGTARPPEGAWLADAEARHRKASAELHAARAWAAVLARPDPAPSWIAPLWQIPELLPPEPDSFDVVVIDGEHGAGVEALFLFWLAPRAVLVGQPGPDLPPPDAPVPAHPLVTPETSLFTFLLDRFPEAPPPREDAWSSPADDAERSPAPVPGRLAFDESPPEPEPEEEEEQQPRARSIVTYKRPELVELVREISEAGPGLSDDEIVETARERLGCPADEEMLAGARLRFALESLRETSGTE
ncbi:hypothetical protein [Actinomadura macrotermitis]|uniref:Uncharacterized protein n=1 Tax=Actinomadura macrotermitis TaxID=2585200 RepID=A0A7K0C0F2_9ACTN|nr:hypothetical protein [Actinomadura macrotermitis]MQY06943.1 hypothetical protein [Actinomadura macrotermitis]